MMGSYVRVEEGVSRFDYEKYTFVTLRTIDCERPSRGSQTSQQAIAVLSMTVACALAVKRPNG